ncbi:MAG: hypothetical protein VXZ13_12390, partial [Pseudomonadota bacterium]|nr:hypothetical protein [Pseudomonadota bacterium]
NIDLSGATSVTAVIVDGTKDLTGTTLDSEVTILDLATNQVQGAIFDVSDINGKTILDTNATFTVKDSATTLAANTNVINGKAVVIDDTGATAATVQELNAIQAVASSVTYTKLRDSSANIRANVDSNGAITDVDGIAVTVTTTSNATEFGSILTAAGNGSVTGAVADAGSALTDVTFPNASSITATISAATDLTTVTLDGDVTHIDLNDVTNVLLDINDLTNRTIVNTSGNGSYKVKDTAANLAGAAEALLSDQTIVVDDSSTAATTTEINSIQTKMVSNGGNGTVTYTKLTDTASNLDTNKADIVAGVAVTIDETGQNTPATVAELNSIQTQVASVNNASLTYTKLRDTSANIRANVDENNAITDVAGIAVTVTTASNVTQYGQIVTAAGNNGSV